MDRNKRTESFKGLCKDGGRLAMRSVDMRRGGWMTMSEERVKCKGGCGRDKSYGETDKDGFGLYCGDKMLEWVCEECWKNGVRTRRFEELARED